MKHKILIMILILSSNIALIQNAECIEETITISICDYTKDIYAFMEENQTVEQYYKLFEQDNIDIMNIRLTKNISSLMVNLEIDIVDITQNLAYSMLPLIYNFKIDNISYFKFEVSSGGQYDSLGKLMYDSVDDYVLNITEWNTYYYYGTQYSFNIEHHLYKHDTMFINFKDKEDKITKDSEFYMMTSCRHYRANENGSFLFSVDIFPNLDGYDYNGLYCGEVQTSLNFYLLLMLVFPIIFLINFLLVKYMNKIYKPIVLQERYTRRG